MTVAALTASISYNENGVGLTFPVPFRYLDPTHLVVTRTTAAGVQTTLSNGVDWSATAGATDAGGTLTLTASVNGCTLTIRRRTPRTQATDYVANDRFPAETHEATIDRAMLIDQEQDVDLGRALLVPVGEGGLGLPAKASRLGKYLAFDGAGNPIPADGVGAVPTALQMTFTQSGVGAVARSVSAELAAMFTGPQFGTNGATGADDSLPILNMANAANGNLARLPVGQFRVDATRVFNALTHIYGAGSGEGPGTVAGVNCTQLVANFSTGHIWDFAPSVYGPTIEGIQFNSYSARAGGAAIHLKGTGTVSGAGPYTVTGSTVSGYRIANCAFNSQLNGITIDVPGWGEITRTYHQAWVNQAIETNGNGVQYLGTSYGNEGHGGWINKNFFFGNTSVGTSQYSAFYSRTGYYKFTENHVLGSKIGIWQEISQYPAGGIEIRGNLFEEQDVASIYITPLGGAQQGSMLKIHDNEFSVASLGAAARVNFQSHITILAGSAAWLTDVSICNNVMRTCAARPGYSFINLQSGSNVSICNNELEGLTGNTMQGIQVGAQATNVQVLDNLVIGAFSNKYVLTTNCLLRDFRSNLTATEVAAITCADGSMVWVADGNPLSPTLSGGSTGCIAVMRGGVWSPLVTMHSAVAGYGTPSGGARLSSFPGATATLAQTSGALAQLILDLKAQGLLKA